MQIHFASFRQLDIETLYELIKLRIDIFVVEQACPYHELDGQDPDANTIHVLGYEKETLIAYSRILNPGARENLSDSGKTSPLRIGRVLVRQDYRNRGNARLLIQSAIDYIHNKHPKRAIALAAQVKICGLYEALGFRFVSGQYLEDDILHIDMILDAPID